jgi:predicted dehydrogenase
MTVKRVGIIMNGVTGRMGRNQHLARSIAAIRADGGVEADGVVIWPDPILLGRDLDKLRRLGEAHGIERFSTDLNGCLANQDDQVYFDAQITSRREEAITAAIDAGKAVYCEKPVSTTSLGGVEIARLAEKAGVRNGAVQDKLFLPGILKLAQVLASGQLGRLLSVRLEFGYWVFEDEVGVGQRPSWNYRADKGGGIVLDMFCHFRYLLDHLFGGVRSVLCTARTEVPRRVDERDKAYKVTAEDSAYALVELAGGAIAQVSASWCVRPFRHDLLVIHVNGSSGSASAGLRQCWVQPATATPVFVWNPDLPQEIDPMSAWLEVPDETPSVNAFRRQWELFLRHVALDEPFPWDLMDSVRGVQLAERAMLSNSERRWVDIPELSW